MDRLSLLVLVLASGCYVPAAPPGTGVTGGDGDPSVDVGGGDGDADGHEDPDGIVGPGGEGEGEGEGGEARLAPEIGLGDHSAGSVDLEVVLDGSDLAGPTGLAFATDRPGDLWIVDRDDDSWTILNDADGGGGRVDRYYDDSSHFLNAPTSLSFAAPGDHALATCQDSANDYNGLQQNDFWMGPTAWTSDRALFSGGEASHYDMAHEESFCMGIAWTEAHVWWVFDGFDGSLDRVDFHGWHPDAPGGLGGEDHSDGEIFRYAAGEVRSVTGVPSHMVYAPDDGYLYVADTGNARLVRIDASADDCERGYGRTDEMAMYWCDDPLETVVPAGGELTEPSGLAMHDGYLYVTDHADGRILAFTRAGELVNWLDTGLGADALAGIALSPNGVVYFLDMRGDRLYRIRT